MFELLYFVQHHERQLILYSLDLRVSCSTYLTVFMAYEGTLNFPIITTDYVIVSS